MYLSSRRGKPAHITLCVVESHHILLFLHPSTHSLVPLSHPAPRFWAAPACSRKELWALPCAVPSAGQEGTCCARAQPAGPVRPAAGGPDDYYPPDSPVNTEHKSPWAQEVTLGTATAKDERRDWPKTTTEQSTERVCCQNTGVRSQLICVLLSKTSTWMES